MKEKVFQTLFRLISSGQLNAEEAYYLMDTLFSDNHKTNIGIWQPQQAPVVNPSINPYWNTYTTTSCPELNLSSTSKSAIDGITYTVNSNNTVCTDTTTLNCLKQAEADYLESLE